MAINLLTLYLYASSYQVLCANESVCGGGDLMET